MRFRRKQDEQAPSSQEVLFVYSSSSQQTSGSLSVSA